MNRAVAEYAHLPPHPMEPFLRIVGVAVSRPTEAGGRCPWGIAFHVVFPHSPRPYRAVRARIYECGRDAPLLELPEQLYPQGPCVAHTELFDSRVLVDREVGEVFDVQRLPPGPLPRRGRAGRRPRRGCRQRRARLRGGTAALPQAPDPPRRRPLAAAAAHGPLPGRVRPGG